VAKVEPEVAEVKPEAAKVAQAAERREERSLTDKGRNPSDVVGG
jgi:hypothetical protein